MSTVPEMLRLRKGLLANLPTDLTPGAISITTDEGGMYLDTATERVRLSDVRVVASLSAVVDKFENILYFATSTGDLAVWNKTESKWEYIRDNTKLNKNLGAEHKNKILAVNATGDITPVVLTAGDIKAGADVDATSGKSPDAGRVLVVDDNGMAAVGDVDMSSKQDVQIGTSADADRIVTVDADGKITLSTKKVADKFDAVHDTQLNKILVTNKTTGAVEFVDDLTGSQVKVSTNTAEKDYVLVVDANGEIGIDNKKMSDKQDAVIGSASDAEKILFVDANGKIAMSDKKVSDKQDAQIGAAKVDGADSVDAGKTLIVNTDGKISVSSEKIADKLNAKFAAETDKSKVVVTDENGNIVTSALVTTEELDTLEGILTQDGDGNPLTIQDQIDDLKADIDAKLQAADAMVFKGVVISAAELGVVNNPNGDPVEAGWTYKAGAAFDINGTLVRIGDLLIADADQEGNTYTGGWSHVNSGYVDDYASKFIVDATNNKITLDNTLGDAEGSVKFASASENLTVTTTATDNNNAVVTFGLVWGSFSTEE